MTEDVFVPDHGTSPVFAPESATREALDLAKALEQPMDHEFNERYSADRPGASPMAYLQLLAQGWTVIESDGWHMTIQAPDDWHENGPGELVVNTAVWCADFEPVTCTDNDIENVTDIAITLERTYLECGSITARDNAAAMRSVLAYANRYRYLRHAEISRPQEGGIFIGETPSNLILTEEDADRAIDALIRNDTFFDDDPMSDAPHDQLQKLWDDADGPLEGQDGPVTRSGMTPENEASQ